MAEFGYYGTIDEWWLLFNVIIKRFDLRFAIDRPYPTAQCNLYDSVDTEVKAAMPHAPRLYLVGGSFSRVPLYLRRQERGTEAGLSFIDNSRGGPSLDLSPP